MSADAEAAGGAERARRAGVVALVGPPNAGKSTLLNAILGQKLAIVTAKPQTTRSRILGIRPHRSQRQPLDAQLVFYDTPGRHHGSRLLNVALNESVSEAVEGCDVGALLVDLTRGWTDIHDALCAELEAQRVPWIAVGTKLDLPEARRAAWPPPEAPAALRVSARTGEGLEELLDALAERLPEGPPLYPEDDLTDRPVRWLAAELVREAATEELSQELPYELAVQVREFDESRPDLVTIRAVVFVVRESQKRIVVGRGGEMIKRIGMRARREIEELVGRQVHLELRVKVDPRWLKSPARIRGLGYL